MKIGKFLKKIIEIKNNDLSFFNVGDIIWAKRYLTLVEKKKIKKGHQESPYVIIKKQVKKYMVYNVQVILTKKLNGKWLIFLLDALIIIYLKTPI